MKFEELTGQVQRIARLPNQGETMRAICATLETLGERIHEGEASHLEAQLPSGVGAYLRLANKTESFSLSEFYERVAEREGAGVGMPDAVHHARSVMAVIEEAVTPGQLGDLRAQLPQEYDELFELETST